MAVGSFAIDRHCRAGGGATACAPPDTIVVFLDQARLVQLPDRAANLVIGNPLIADLSIQPGGLTVHHRQELRRDQLHRHRQKGVVLMEKTSR